MVNHYRTLLLNLDGDAVVPEWVIGEEYVPPDYPAVRPLPTPLVDVRARLFGADPDRSFLNYRLAQYLRVAHAAPELDALIRSADSRLTYVGVDRLVLYGADAFVPLVESPAGVPPLVVQGEPVAPDPTGQSYHAYDVIVLDGSTVQVDQVRPLRPQSHLLEYAIVGGMTDATLPLGDSGYAFFMPAAANGTTWRVTFHARPQWDPGRVAAGFAVAGEPTLLGLFGGPAPSGPLLALRNLFEARSELPYRLGSVVCALALSTEAARGG